MNQIKAFANCEQVWKLSKKCTLPISQTAKSTSKKVYIPKTNVWHLVGCKMRYLLGVASRKNTVNDTSYRAQLSKLDALVINNGCFGEKNVDCWFDYKKLKKKSSSRLGITPWSFKSLNIYPEIEVLKNRFSRKGIHIYSNYFFTLKLWLENV